MSKATTSTRRLSRTRLDLSEQIVFYVGLTPRVDSLGTFARRAGALVVDNTGSVRAENGDPTLSDLSIQFRVLEGDSDRAQVQFAIPVGGIKDAFAGDWLSMRAMTFTEEIFDRLREFSPTLISAVECRENPAPWTPIESIVGYALRTRAPRSTPVAALAVEVGQ